MNRSFKYFNVFSFLFMVSFGWQVSAQSKNEKSSTVKNETKSAIVLKDIEKPESFHFETKPILKLMGGAYVSDLPEAPEQSRSQYFSIRIKAPYASTNSLMDQTRIFNPQYFQFDGGLDSGFKMSQNYLVINELSLNWSQNQSGFWGAVGRKNLTWNDLDQNWNLSLWQPIHTPDPIRPEQQGLTGFYSGFRNDNVSFNIFASPIYIPNTNPDIRTDSGLIISDSRWRRKRTQDFNFNGRLNKIAYNIDVPSNSDIVFQPAGAMSLHVGQKRGFWTRASAAVKSVNEILIARDIVKRTSEDIVDVRLYPKVAQHKIGSLDIGYRGDRAQVSISTLADIPTVVAASADGAIQKLSDLQAHAIQLDLMPFEKTFPDFKIGLGYLNVNGGEIQDITVTEQPDERNLFDSRVNFKNAGRFDLQMSLFRLKTMLVGLKTTTIYDWSQKGSLFAGEISFNTKNSIGFLLGAEVIGVEDESYNTTSFLNQFRANDRIYGGVSYVF